MIPGEKAFSRTPPIELRYYQLKNPVRVRVRVRVRVKVRVS